MRTPLSVTTQTGSGARDDSPPPLFETGREARRGWLKSHEGQEESPKPRTRRPEKGSPPRKRLEPESLRTESKPEEHPEPGG